MFVYEVGVTGAFVHFVQPTEVYSLPGSPRWLIVLPETETRFRKTQSCETELHDEGNGVYPVRCDMAQMQGWSGNSSCSGQHANGPNWADMSICGI